MSEISTPHSLAEHQVTRFVTWYEGACQRINKRIKQEEEAIKALRLTQRLPTGTARCKNPERRPRRLRGQAYSAESQARVEKLMQEGYSIAKIAETIGYSTTTARTIIRQVLTKQSPVEGQAHTGHLTGTQQ